MPKHQMITFRAKILSNSRADLIVEIRGGRFMYLPKNVVTIQKHNTSVYDYLTMPEWLALKNGLVQAAVPVTAAA